MDTFVCSSWYHLRYPYAKREDVAFEKNVKQVDKYVGGAEHSCMHLLYARFFNMFLHDQGLVNFEEPFPSLVHQGMILAKDGSKMSKSKGNTISPDDYVDKYGSDILRLFMLFGFKYAEGGPWNDDTVAAIVRFVERVEKVVRVADPNRERPTCIPCCKVGVDPEEVLFVQANTIKSVRADLEVFSFNTAVARCMEFLNAIEKNPKRECVETLVVLLAPMIPHIAEEFWGILGHAPSIINVPFPQVNEKYLVRDEIEIAVQINSKIVGRIMVPSTATQKQVEEICAEFTVNRDVKKAVYIANRLINFII